MNPTLNQRLDYQGNRGVIRYIGPVPREASQIFIGVEWDDPKRGKHNGTFQNIKYFETRHATAGSFLKASLAEINLGVDFLTALKNKYLIPGDSIQDSEIALGGDSSVPVETVGWKKIYQKQKCLNTLLEVGLAEKGLKYAVNSHSPTELRDAELRIQDLDLSKNLFTEIETVGEICQHLNYLSCLRLNGNYFNFSGTLNSSLLSQSFQNVVQLSLASTGISFNEFLAIESFFPKLFILNFGFNGIDSLGVIDTKIQMQNLEHLNLEHNVLVNWSEINKLQHLPNLSHLSLNNNKLESIYFPIDKGFKQLTSANLNCNDINDWKSIHELNYFSSLVDIRLKELPILNSFSNIDKRHYILVARLPNVTLLNKCLVKSRHRLDAEIFYLTLYQNIDTLIDQDHPILSALRAKHSDITISSVAQNTIKQGLLNLKIEYQGNRLEKSVMEKITVRSFKVLIARWLKLKRPKFNLVVETVDGRIFDMDDDGKELLFYSLSASDLVNVQ